MPVVEVRNLVKSYGNFRAVDDISFEVEEGEIFGIAGPNGAGKTTTIECIEGLRKQNGGTIRVLGLDPVKEALSMKQKVGIQLQEGQLPDRIRVWEAINLFNSFYKQSIPWKTLLEELDLEDKASSFFDNLSGGQKQRLSIAMALVNDPILVFFDELTTGLDPQARRMIWDLIRRVRDKGRTIVLVTHFMDEAEKLCDRLAIFDQGKVIALDSPQKLIKQLKEAIQINFSIAGDRKISEHLLRVRGVNNLHFDDKDYKLSVDKVENIADVINCLSETGTEFYEFTIHQPNLEDVFLELTGRTIRD